MKLFVNKYKNLYIISGIVLAIVLIIGILSFALWNKQITKAPGVVFYGFQSEISLEDYLPLNEANKMLSEHDGIAVQVNSNVAYAKGEYKNTSASVCTYDHGTFSIDCDILNKTFGLSLPSGKMSASIIANRTNKSLKVYDDKLVVFLSNGDEINVFDNYYTFEMISLKLREAPAEDFQNALITLPYEVTDGSSYIAKYTDPDLDLGLQTSLYGEQGSGVNCDDKPIIVAGEGNNKKNHTVIRVYNEYSAKIAQFLAFPGNVTGGVRVSAMSIPYGNEERGVIAAASINGKFYEAGSVRVFDEYGRLYMEIVPDFVNEAPYNIATGYFLSDEKDPQLLITNSKIDSECSFEYEIYSLSDGEKLTEGTGTLCDGIRNKKITIALYDDSVDSILMNLGDNFSFKISFAKNGISYKKICEINDNITNGIYQSAFEGIDYIGTENMRTNEEGELNHQSFIKLFTTGSVGFTELNVGISENIFYYNGSHKKITFEDTDYVKKAGFLHIRTDLSATPVQRASNAENISNIAVAAYSEWECEYAKNLAAQYSYSYNVWEPCFTHRWNMFQCTENLAEYKDKDGNYKFSSVDNEGNPTIYNELDSAFYVGTYAEGLIELDKMRIYPLRSALQTLYTEFYKDTSYMVALEPIHEIEINSGDESVGDYNAYMIESFRSFLISRYDNINNINKKFGTDFKSREDIMPPTNTDSTKAWDKYEGEYFDEWTIFTRQIVNKRLSESFREALLAGFPAEIINGHSIPEGEAISGFLGEANTRISPIDAMMTLGCGFGATRYGYWCQSDANFLKYAYSAGFRNTTLGEYNSMEQDQETNLIQIRYVWTHGAKFINIMNPVNYVGGYYDYLSVKELAEENLPRPGQTNGTKMSVPYVKGTKRYQIVEIGGDGETPGLLKSVDVNGNWTGDVYLTPFHSYIDVESYSLSTNARTGAIFPSISNLNTGDMIEINFIGSYSGSDNAKLHIEVYEDGIYSEKLSSSFNLTDKAEVYKFVISNQTVLGTIKIKTYFECDNLNKINVNSFSGNVMRESVARVFYGDTTANFTKCGTYFDIINK